MNGIAPRPPEAESTQADPPVNLSRRGFLIASSGAAVGSFVLGMGLPVGKANAQQASEKIIAGTRVPAFLEIHADNSIKLFSPFAEGGQGIFTAMAQIVGEELDADPTTFAVENAPPGPDYLIKDDGTRYTGGSKSVRMGYKNMRRLGAIARRMLLQAASNRLSVPIGELTTEPGHVIHAASGRSLSYGEIAAEAMALPVPDLATITLKDPSEFRWLRKPIPRVDVYDKSNGKAIFAIDIKVDGMLHAAVQHAPRLGLTVGPIRNEADVKAMHGVHSVHRLPGAIAVVAERWWDAKKAAEALIVDWQDSGKSADPQLHYMPADFSSAAFREGLVKETGNGKDAEVVGNIANAFADAKTVVSSTATSQYLRHAQLEPPSTIARFNDDGTLDVWIPNLFPDMFQKLIGQQTGLDISKINIHSPLIGGFFGRHYIFPGANPYPQAVQLAKEAGRPVKVIWSREEEFLRDPLRPMAAVRMRGALDADGMPIAIEAITVGSGPTENIFGYKPDKIDPTAVEGLTGKPYAIPNIRVAQVYVPNPTMLAYWRSVGNSMNDFFYETFLDELADKGGKDPYELRIQLLQGNKRLTRLLTTAGELSGGWKRGPFTAADGSRRARGVAMASPFGSFTAAIAEVSIHDGQVVVHDIWEAVDPGNIVNPAIIDAQLNSAAALGLSQLLVEEAAYENGEPVSRNYDLYPILPSARMPRMHIKIIESGEAMGGIGEPGLPAIPPAVANAVSTLTGQRIRHMPLSQYSFSS